jgi:hypothetical protein
VAANEIANRFAAACWVRCGGAGGEAPNSLDPSTIRYRSRVGFTNRIITTTDANARPLLILPLDRELSRRETAVIAKRVGTVGRIDLFTARESYPDLGTVPSDVAQVFVQPMHLDWMGDDLSAPDYLPFGISPSVVPTGFDVDLYNAVAVLLPFEGGEGLSGDFCVFVVQHPHPDAVDQPVRQILPFEVPPTDPIFALGPTVWWRMDTFTTVDDEGGEHINEFTDRTGQSVGNLTQHGDTSGLPSADPNFNNQVVWSPTAFAMSVVDGSATDPTFWSFLLSGQCSIFIVFSQFDAAPQSVMVLDSSQFDLTIDPGGSDDITISIGTAGAILTDALNPFGATDVLGQILYFIGQIGAPNFTFANTAAGIATGAWDSAPGEASTGVAEFGAAGCTYAEILMFDRTLSAPDLATVLAYLNTRYAIPLPS